MRPTQISVLPAQVSVLPAQIPVANTLKDILKNRNLRTLWEVTCVQQWTLKAIPQHAFKGFFFSTSFPRSFFIDFGIPQTLIFELAPPRAENHQRTTSQKETDPSTNTSRKVFRKTRGQQIARMSNILTEGLPKWSLGATVSICSKRLPAGNHARWRGGAAALLDKKFIKFYKVLKSNFFIQPLMLNATRPILGQNHV